MIVSFIATDNTEQLLVCPRGPTTVAGLRERMLERAKVAPGSYACDLIENLHRDVFLRCVDLKADYVEYFAREYESVAEYIRRRWRFPSAVVAEVVRAFEVSSGVYHFRGPWAFLAGSYGRQFLTRLLEDLPAAEEL